MAYDIEALKRKMLVKYPFFGSVVVDVDYKESDTIPTAGTDGEIIYYNSRYLESLSLDEQIFVIAHVVCHIAFNHILRSEGKDQQIWNIATDGVINQFLKRDGLKLAPGVVDIEDAINYDAEQLYEKLLQEKQQRQQQTGQGNDQNNQQQIDRSSQGKNRQPSQSQQQTDDSKNQEQNQESQEQNNGAGQSEDNQQQNNTRGNSQEQSKQAQSGAGSLENSQVDKSKQDVGHDTHSMWEEAVKKHQQGQSDSSSSEDKLLNKEKENSELENKQKELEKMGEKEAFKKNLEEKRKQLEALKEAIYSQVFQAGNDTNSDIRIVNDIGRAKPIVDWRYILKEAIKYDVDWSYRHATIEDWVVSANLEEQPMPETEIVLDTSGSINETLLRNFLRECKNILQHSRVKVGCFDTKFYGFNEIRTEKDIESMKFVGGGGTDFNAAVSAFSRRVENKIIFTDGYAEMPRRKVNAIWLVFGNQKINPKGGKVIYVTEEQLKRLNLCENEVVRKLKL